MYSDLVSVIVPCFNASKYISQTLNSILNQTDVLFEVVIIDDGSTDNTAEIISEINDGRVSYYFQNNSGVSSARNKGLFCSKGEYIIFFDADDIMPPNFISSRLDFLKKNIQFNFVSGIVQKFSDNSIVSGVFRGTSNLVFEEILLYNPEVVTCPSNYLFKREFLKSHNIYFNEKLSSTADRFFLLQCAKYGNTYYSKELVPLMYRVSENSMSHSFSNQLISDNELFYVEVNKLDLIPDLIKKKSLFLGNYILTKSYIKNKQFIKALPFLFTCFLKYPLFLLRRVIGE